MEQPFEDSVIRSFRKRHVRPLDNLVCAADLSDGRRQVRQNVPVCPGVYGWLNSDQSLIYVGKSKSLRHRLGSYFAKQTTDPKMARIRRQSASIIWEPVSHEILALIREQELIDRFRPPYNVEGQPDRRQPGFVCVAGGAAPTIFFARKVPGRAVQAFGPFAGQSRLGAAIVGMNYVFQLRDCPDKTPMNFTNQLKLFEDIEVAGCLRYELASCPAPCAGVCSSESYRHNVEKAIKFLKGSDKQTLDRLQTRMKRAAGNLSYERATVLRDQLENLTWMYRHVKQLSTARRKLNGVMQLPGFDGQKVWLVLRGGRLRAALNGTPGVGKTESTIHRIQQIQSERVTIPSGNLDINLLILMSRWIRKQPELLDMMLGFPQSLEI